VLVFIALAATAVACGGTDADPQAGGRSDPSTTEARRPPTPLLLLGDSLMVGARRYGGLRPALRADGWNAVVIAEESRRIAWGIAEVRDRTSVPPVVVVELGTNSGDVGVFAADANALAAALRTKGAETIVWLAPFHRDDARYATRVAALRAVPGISVTDWSGQLADHPEWFQADGIHLTEDGYRRMSEAIVERLENVDPSS
jgi:hypothetical protein